jgi:hypothetical protein
MALDPLEPGLARSIAPLAPYAQKLVQDGGSYALSLHADEVGVEHLLCALMADEDCAAHRLVLHAFADPETIAEEARATAAGILVVGSRCTLSFSVRGVRALFGARELAEEQGAEEVAPEHVLRAAAAELPEAAVAALAAEGWRAAARRAAAGARTGADEPLVGPFGGPLGGPLFRHFSAAARRSLSTAARAASEAREAAISPARLLVGCLRVDAELARRTGLAWSRAGAALRSYTLDATPLEPRRLAPDAGLAGFLAELPPGAGSLEILGAFLGAGTPELASLLQRNKVNAALLARAKGVFLDPDLG